MCLAIPGKIISIKENIAVVDYSGTTREVGILEPGFEVGDYVIVQNKIIVKKVPEDEALSCLDVIEKLECTYKPT